MIELKTIPRPETVADDLHIFFREKCGNHVTMINAFRLREDLYYNLDNLAGLIYLTIENPRSSGIVLERLIARYASILKESAMIEIEALR